jgi:hypothetical protein
MHDLAEIALDAHTEYAGCIEAVVIAQRKSQEAPGELIMQFTPQQADAIQQLYLTACRIGGARFGGYYCQAIVASQMGAARVYATTQMSPNDIWKAAVEFSQ